MPYMSSADFDIRAISPAGVTYGPFKSYDGGDDNKPERIVRPPGQKAVAAHNPNGDRTQVTLVKDFETTDWGALPSLRTLRQPGWKIVVVPKDEAGIAFGSADSDTGALQEVHGPKGNTDDGTATPTLELVFSVDER